MVVQGDACDASLCSRTAPAMRVDGRRTGKTKRAAVTNPLKLPRDGRISLPIRPHIVSTWTATPGRERIQAYVGGNKLEQQVADFYRCSPEVPPNVVESGEWVAPSEKLFHRFAKGPQSDTCEPPYATTNAATATIHVIFQSAEDPKPPAAEKPREEDEKRAGASRTISQKLNLIMTPG
jgi:hypothetical protein